MKRYTGLFERIATPANVLEAFYEARKGKRYRREADRFHARLEENVLELSEELQSGAYRPSGYRSFHVHEPKTRLVSAAPFRDRVVHHAICRVVEPIFETKFIHDTYACRVGKGQHRALDRFTYFARRHAWVMKLDVRKFFPSVDIEKVKELVSRTLVDTSLMALLGRILDSGSKVWAGCPEPVWFPGDGLWTPIERACGLPIGNLTSQLLANVYLSPLDHYVKRELHCQAYLRYMDDLVFFADSRATLVGWRREVLRFLEGWRLRVHPSKCYLGRVEQGTPYLGFRVFPGHRLVLGAGVRRATRRLGRLGERYARGEAGVSQVRQCVAGWRGHVKHADSFGLRESVLRKLVFTRPAAEALPS
ncbi:MAG: RNA-dependent DNA polymerase [Candidatus Wallbacteria bacterium]|nr:RNA-dependent DNA polymerase [Candidatus Wallbacteria bacterium]